MLTPADHDGPAVAATKPPPAVPVPDPANARREKPDPAAADRAGWVHLSPGQTFVRRHRRSVSGAVVIASVATCAALSAGAGWHSVLGRLEHLSLWFLPAVFAAHVVAYASYVVAHHHVIRHPRSPAVGWRGDIYMVAIGFGASVSGGFAVDRLALEWLGSSRTAARISVRALEALEFAVLAPAAWLCALLLLGAPGIPASDTLPWIVGVPIGLVAVGFVVVASGSDNSAPKLTRLARVRAELSTAAAEAIAVLRRPRSGPVAAAAMALYWATDIAALWAALQLTGTPLPVLRLILAYATGYLVTRRTLPLAGVIITEALMAVSLVWVGVPLVAAVPAVLAYRLSDFALTFIAALLFTAATERALARGHVPQSSR